MKVNEGLIKLPSIYSEIEKFVLESYFAYVLSVIPRKFRFDEEQLERAERIVKQAMQMHNVIVTQSQIRDAEGKLFYIKTFKLEENVYGEEVNLKTRVKVMFDRSKKLGSNIGTYYDSTAFILLSPFNMHMTGASLNTISALKNSLLKVHELIGFLKHEVTHLVQYRALKAKSHAQVDSRDYDLTAKFDDSYALDPIEFDPLIKSSIGAVKKYESAYRNLPGYNRQEMIDTFLKVSPAPRWLPVDISSPVFDALKRRAPVKWKRAVKLFMSAY